MGLRVNTNIASLTAQRNLSMVSDRLGRNYARLSSGLRIAVAADDAAGLAISEQMRSQIRSYAVAGRNAQDGISLVQTAEGAMNEVSNILGRMRELAIQASNGTLNDNDRGIIDVEYQALIEEIDRVAGDSQFNEVPLLSSSASLPIQVGIEVSQTISVNTVDATAAGLTASSSAGAFADVLSTSAATAELATIDDAIRILNTSRGDLGAVQNRLQSAYASIQNVRENLSASESRIRDVDVAAETADLTRNSIMQQAATSMLSQANVQPQLALSLLQG